MSVTETAREPRRFDQPGFDLRDGLGALFRHARPALLIVAAALVGAGIYLLLTPTEYTADAKLIIRLGREKAASPIGGGTNQEIRAMSRSKRGARMAPAFWGLPTVRTRILCCGAMTAA